VYVIDFIDDIDKSARAKIMHIMLYLPLLLFFVCNWASSLDLLLMVTEASYFTGQI